MSDSFSLSKPAPASGIVSFLVFTPGAAIGGAGGNAPGPGIENVAFPVRKCYFLWGIIAPYGPVGQERTERQNRAMVQAQLRELENRPIGGRGALCGIIAT